MQQESPVHSKLDVSEKVADGLNYPQTSMDFWQYEDTGDKAMSLLWDSRPGASPRKCHKKDLGGGAMLFDSGVHNK